MILLEKYDITNGKNELLTGWTTLFKDVEDLINFLNEHKNHLLGGKLDRYQLIIRNVGEIKEVKK